MGRKNFAGRLPDEVVAVVADDVAMEVVGGGEGKADRLG